MKGIFFRRTFITNFEKYHVFNKKKFKVCQNNSQVELKNEKAPLGNAKMVNQFISWQYEFQVLIDISFQKKNY